MFLHLSIILFTGGRGSAQPPDAGHPNADPPPQGWAGPPDADPPPLGRPSQMQTPLGLGRSPRCRPPIWSTSGRYASYWNAYLFSLKIQRSHGLKMRFCETLNQIISHRSDGFLLTPHKGVFKEISPIVVSFSIKSYRTEIVSVWAL